MIVPCCLFAVLVLVVLIRLFYVFHRSEMEKDEVYEPELSLYSMLSPIGMLGLGMAQSVYVYLPIYLSPLALLLLIVLLNRSYEIISRAKVLFYLIEVGLAGFAVGFVMAPDSVRSYILLAAIFAGIIGSAV